MSLAQRVPRHPEELSAITLPVPTYEDIAWEARGSLSYLMRPSIRQVQRAAAILDRQTDCKGRER